MSTSSHLATLAQIVAQIESHLGEGAVFSAEGYRSNDANIVLADEHDRQWSAVVELLGLEPKAQFPGPYPRFGTWEGTVRGLTVTLFGPYVPELDEDREKVEATS